MKKYILICLVFISTQVTAQKFFEYNYPDKMYWGEEGVKLERQRSHQFSLDLSSFDEMSDSANKYVILYRCAKRCNRWSDSTKYYSWRASFFINQIEYYCAILFGADSIGPLLYHKPNEPHKRDPCKCDYIDSL